MGILGAMFASFSFTLGQFSLSSSMLSPLRSSLAISFSFSSCISPSSFSRSALRSSPLSFSFSSLSFLSSSSSLFFSWPLISPWRASRISGLSCQLIFHVFTSFFFTCNSDYPGSRHTLFAMWSPVNRNRIEVLNLIPPFPHRPQGHFSPD